MNINKITSDEPSNPTVTSGLTKKNERFTRAYRTIRYAVLAVNESDYVGLKCASFKGARTGMFITRGKEHVE